jgi:hypothetical protein
MSEIQDSEDWNDLRYPDRWEKLSASEQKDCRRRVTDRLVCLASQLAPPEKKEAK